MIHDREDTIAAIVGEDVTERCYQPPHVFICTINTNTRHTSRTPLGCAWVAYLRQAAIGVITCTSGSR